jgi:hypothetical protein
MKFDAVLTDLALRLAGIFGKRHGFPFASGRLWRYRSGLVDASKPSNQQHQQDKESTDERIKN